MAFVNSQVWGTECLDETLDEGEDSVAVCTRNDIGEVGTEEL